MHLTGAGPEHRVIQSHDPIEGFTDPGEFERKAHERPSAHDYFCVITPGTYQSIFHRPPSSIGFPAARRSVPAVSFIGPVKICLPATIAARFGHHPCRPRPSAQPCCSMRLSVPPSLMPGKAPYGLGFPVFQLRPFFSAGIRCLSQVQADEHSVAFGANSRRSR